MYANTGRKTAEEQKEKLANAANRRKGRTRRQRATSTHSDGAAWTAPLRNKQQKDENKNAKAVPVQRLSTAGCRKEQAKVIESRGKGDCRRSGPQSS